MQAGGARSQFEVVSSRALELRRHSVAVLIPCYNEGRSIAKVVEDFRAALPGAAIVVFDNNSSDNTASEAQRAGARVFRETRQGKGFVVRRMFADVDADLYVLVDGDATYDAASAPKMIERLLHDRLDMVVASRRDSQVAAYRPGHRAGNRLFSNFVALVFGAAFTDILSGYRVLSRRFVKSFPLMSRGFEIETELTIHALELGLPVAEIETPYYARAEGSISKLSTWKDGFRIVRTMIGLFRAERPLAFFSAIAALLAAASIILAVPLMITYVETGLVPRLPTAVLCTGLMLAAFLSVASGLVLDTVTRGRRETKLLAYLSHRAPGEDSQNA
jgi:glycosyltransferase involved in cell wall biosynthesis